MSDAVAVSRPTGWDIAVGALLVLAGLYILGNVVFATAFTLILLGWISLIGGIALFIASFFRIKTGGFWSAALGGALLGVFGLVVLRNPLESAAILTLIAGTLFLAGGIVRIVIGIQNKEHRWLFVISGIASVILGLIVVFNIWAATLTLLGVLIGVQALIEGITLMLTGRFSSGSGLVATT